MGETERRGRMLLIAAALTGTLMLVLAGVLAAPGLPGASLSAASMPRPGAPEHGNSLESSPARAPAAPSHLSMPRRATRPHPRSAPIRPGPAIPPPRSAPAGPRPTPSPSRIPPSSAGVPFRTTGEAGANALSPADPPPTYPQLIPGHP